MLLLRFECAIHCAPRREIVVVGLHLDPGHHHRRLGHYTAAPCTTNLVAAQHQDRVIGDLHLDLFQNRRLGRRLVSQTAAKEPFFPCFYPFVYQFVKMMGDVIPIW